MPKQKTMTVDDLIFVLEKVKAESGGETPVKINSYCGTNNGHVSFDITKINKRAKIANHVNSFGEFCLSGTISNYSVGQIKEGIVKMKALGYRFYRSQFCKGLESPTEGMSPCSWHIPW